jgi:hypothetical protein
MSKDQKYVQEVIERYIYQVTRRLPVSQREDIKKELQGLIEDMLAERTNDPTREDIDAVLLELGTPWNMANKYLDSKQYLIGPEYYSLYMFVLKIVLGAVALGMTIALSIGFVVTPPESIAAGVGSFFSSVFFALLQAFAWMTFGFAMAERYSKKKISFQNGKWKPSDLPPMPEKKTAIRRSDPIASMIFTVIVMIVFNTAPQIMSAYVGGNPVVAVPIFNLDNWTMFIGVFNILFALGLIKDFVRLLFGRYNITLGITVTIINIATLAITVMLLGNPLLWNPNFAQMLHNLHAFGTSTSFDLQYYFELFKKILIGIIILGTVVDTIAILTRSIRHSVSEREF